MLLKNILTINLDEFHYKEIWQQCCQSVCKITLFNHKVERLSSGTGFVIDNCIITNNHVLNIPGVEFISFAFKGADGIVDGPGGLFEINYIRSNIADALPESSWDYAILNFEPLTAFGVPSLVLSKEYDCSVGSNVAILGYPFEKENLSINKGIISSRFTNNEVNYIQVDASVNQGNSGGPLISLETIKFIF